MPFADTDHLIAAEQAHSEALAVLAIFEKANQMTSALAKLSKL